MKHNQPPSLKAWLYAFFVSFLFVIPISGHAISNCAIGLLRSSVAPTIDGVNSAGEWTDSGTSVLDSSVASSCLDPLKDYVAINDTYPDRRVTIHSKRYSVDHGDDIDLFVGFFLTIKDGRREGPCAMDRLCWGERIVVQFNPLINGDNRLDTAPPDQDRRFVLINKWVNSGDPSDDNLIEGELLIGPAADAAACPVDASLETTDSRFVDAADTGITYKMRSTDAETYTVEIAVPVDFINPSGYLQEDIGVAISVINDFGKGSFGGPSPGDDPDYACSASDACEAAGTSFPNSLPVVNNRNPVDAFCQNGWTTPRRWGVGYLTDPPGDYSISRLPYYTSSNAITVFECDNLGYTYYPEHPCLARIEAQVQNTGAVTTKKVAFLWAKHGTGDPAEYNFVDLQDAVLASGTVTTPVTTTVSSVLWDSVPVGQANHPCLRVYIFPDSLSAADEAVLRGTGTGGVISRTDLNALVGAYGVQTNHWAQKNISRHSTITNCPDDSCEQAHNQLFKDIRISLIDSAQAQTGETGLVIAPNVLSGDLLSFSKNNVIVQVKTVAYRLLPEGETHKYSFIENFGGIVQVYPVTMVQENPQLPLEFLVSNFSDETMRIKLLYDIYKPDAIGDTNLEVANVADRIITLEPGTETTVQGRLVNQDLSEPNCGPWLAFICALSKLQILVLLVVLFVLVIVMFVIFRARSNR